MEGLGFGVSVAIIEAGRVLLIQRADFEVWALPGGIVDPGESAAQAAIREAKEETGIDIRLERLVGIYYVPMLAQFGLNAHNVVFAGAPVGGALTLSNETLDVSYFRADDLPEAMIAWHKRRIQDALEGATGLCCTQEYFLPQNLTLPKTRAELYKMRDRSGLSPSTFLKQYFDSPTGDSVELGETR